jgi:hypothetical protein
MSNIKQHNTPKLTELTKNQITQDLVNSIHTYFRSYKVLWYEDYFPYENEIIIKLELNNKKVYLVPPTNTTKAYRYEVYMNNEKLLSGVFELIELNNILSWMLRV